MARIVDETIFDNEITMNRVEHCLARSITSVENLNLKQALICKR